jgi:hypothetical protein
MKRPAIRFLLLFAMQSIPVFSMTAQAQTPSTDWPIVTRRGDALFEGDRPFRFFGIDAPNLFQNEGQLLPDFSNRFPDEYEIRDVFEAMRYLEGRATRTFSLSVYSPDDPAGLPVFIERDGSLNEEALRTLDLTLALAREYDVRLIIPIIASQHFGGWHGVDEFAAIHGKGPGLFWTDAGLKAACRALFESLASRKNTVSGLRYKDDPAILAWQFGNEFDVYASDNGFDRELLKRQVAAWSIEMAAFMKKVDPNHLVFSAGFELEEYLASPDIDAVSLHLYEHWRHLAGNDIPLAETAAEIRAWSRGKKPLVIDEFGMASVENCAALMKEIREDGIAGGLLWGIRGHRRDGGWYYHNEGGSRHNSYHIPGFAAGENYFERDLLNLLRENAFALRKVAPPPIRPPVQAPVLIRLREGLSWRGSTLAQSYVLERAPSPEGPWETLATGIEDSNIADALALEQSGASDPGPIFTDQSRDKSRPAFYRVKGANASGESEWSQVFEWQP